MIRQRFIKTDSVPPNRFRFTVPETGMRIDGELSWDGLLSRVKEHYEDNSIPLPKDWKERVEDQLCRQLPHGWCEYTDGTPTKGARPILSAEGIIKGITALATMAIDKAAGKEVFVDQNEANRRAEICSRCYNNMTTNFCAGCSAMQTITGLVSKVRGARTTPSDASLYTCGSCGCRNEAIVHIQRKVLLSGEKPETTEARPDWCWLKTEDLTQASAALKI